MDTKLTIKMDYTPLYEVSPKTLRMTLPVEKNEAQEHFTVVRTDGKPLRIDRFTSSQPWISAAFDPCPKAGDNFAQVSVTVRRPAVPPPMISASIDLWDTNQATHSVQNVLVAGEIHGEVAATPSQIYWVIPDFGKDKSKYPEASLMRTIELKSVLGREIQIKNPSSDIKGLKVSIVTKEPGKTFDLVVKYDELPKAFSKGQITVETSLASVPRLEVPITVSAPIYQ